MPWVLFVVASLLECSGPCRASGAGNAVDFVQDVAPVVQRHCIRCHRPDNRKGEISLATATDLVEDGFIVPGKPDSSSLLALVESKNGKRAKMPADGEVLSADEISVLRKWIADGAKWPEKVIIQEAARAGREWWSWQPVRRVQPPTIADSDRWVGSADWTENPIDRFILQELLRQGLRPASVADRRVLIRRLSFDLRGLPPTPEEVSEFLYDTEALAYERLVDRMLASPQYGERWARHWLDTAHYADTHGFERDQRRDNAWRYRDWVIQSLNSDLPYDRFIKEQLAGDVMQPDDAASVIATGFLAAGPWDFVGQAETRSEVLKRAARADDLDDMVTQVMTATCGVTVNCARCHDHKLDPISQRDYYGLWAVFAGVKRGERDVSMPEVRELEHRRLAARSERQRISAELAQRHGPSYDLADIVGGGDGKMTGTLGAGIDPLTGGPQIAKRAVLENTATNVFVRSSVRFVDGVVIPDSHPEGTPISSTGLKLKPVPKTSGQVWDAIRFGPVNSQFSTKLDGVDFTGPDHTLLALHANAGITFDLEALRKAGAPAEMKLTAQAGYFGETAKSGASFVICLDGVAKVQRDKIGRSDGLIAIDLAIPAACRFLTLMATDGGNGIGHDQICFGDAKLIPSQPAKDDPENQIAIQKLRQRRDAVELELKSIPAPQRVYAVVSETPAVIKTLKRGDPEQPGDEVQPASLAAVASLNPSLATNWAPEGARRLALAEWIVSSENPLTRRVMMNRLWHYHFGMGIVDTPSDFGFGGGKPSHPQLLDWLSEEFLKQRWSLKAMHRLICTSQTYRQQSFPEAGPHVERARAVDAGNRLLWHMNPRRLDGESVRDAVLAISGKLNVQMYGPGYRDFEYQEEYAPVYRYITPDAADLWRRSIYRFVVRTTTHQFLTTLDCPSPANLTPARNVTTTALQSLALLNNDFVLRQSQYMALRLKADAGDEVPRQIVRAFNLALGRMPTEVEQKGAEQLVRSQGLFQLCRMLMNTNEFVYVD